VKQLKSLILEEKAKSTLLACLEEIPFLTAKVSEPSPLFVDKRPNFEVLLKLPHAEQELLVEVKGNGQPRFIREAVNQVLRFIAARPSAYGIVVAPYISPRSAEICMRGNVGYMDFAGNCYLCLQQIFIKQAGNPNPFSEERSLRSLFSPKASRLLHVLLLAPKRRWKLQDLAHEAKVSLGLASNVKKQLLDCEWIQEQSDGLYLAEPKLVLDEWTKNYSFRKNQVRDYYTLKNLSEFEFEFTEWCHRHQWPSALTGLAGAARMVSAVRYRQTMVYVPNEVFEQLKQVELKEVTSGANVSLLVPFDEGVYYGSRNYETLQVVSPIQLYLDLQGLRNRGEEAADLIRQEVIEPSW
jgi:hypothetical protein